jgi:hypothetical protein
VLTVCLCVAYLACSSDVAEEGGEGVGSWAGPAPATGAGADRFKYLLQAVIVHHGSADGGHYTTYRRLSRVDREGLDMGGHGLLSDDINAWVHISDDEVRPAGLDEVLACEAYMLFYQSVNSLPSAQDLDL